MAKRKILYYISSHGYGHAARSGQVIKELLREYEVQIKTLAPPWLLEQVIGEKTVIIPTCCDVGCLQINNQDVDIPGTLKAYRQQSLKNQQTLSEEVAFIQENRIDLIISDSGSFPFLVAKKAAIPSLFIGNFTWKGIYQHYLDSPTDPVLLELDEEYGMATRSLITPFAIEMPELKNQSRINLIARIGRDIRKELFQRYKIPQGNKLIFHYAGNLGKKKGESDRIKAVEGFTVLSFSPMTQPTENFVYLEKGSFRHEDVTASSDLLLVKPGYGMLSEALANRVPVIFPPRLDFAEYFAFLKEFEKAGGYLSMERNDFETGNWSEYLVQACKLTYQKEYAANGAVQSKAEVDKLLR